MTPLVTARRLIVTTCSAVAVVAATAAATWAAPSSGLAACPNGEDRDTYTGNCVPYLVPNSPSGNSKCPPGVHGAECGSAEIRSGPTAPVTPTGPEQDLEGVSTPDF